VPIPNPDPAPAPQQQDALPGLSQAQLSIRSAITAATEVTQPVEDVL
jgi:hypothetical protein